jgi:hypothetical protein
VFIKVDKKAKKEQLLTSYPPAETDGEITVDEYQLETVDRRSDELNDLEGGEVFLPAEIFLHAWSHRRQEVVEVHHNVYQRVEECKERSLSSGRESEPRPYVHRQQSMVENVKRRDLVIFLAEHKEQSVEKIDKL